MQRLRLSCVAFHGEPKRSERGGAVAGAGRPLAPKALLNKNLDAAVFGFFDAIGGDDGGVGFTEGEVV